MRLNLNYGITLKTTHLFASTNKTFSLMEKPGQCHPLSFFKKQKELPAMMNKSTDKVEEVKIHVVNSCREIW